MEFTAEPTPDFESCLDIAVVTLMAENGVLMASIPWSVILQLLAVVMVFLLLLDSLKARIYQRFEV